MPSKTSLNKINWAWKIIPQWQPFIMEGVFFIETSYHKTNHKQDFWETFVTGKSIVLHFLLGFVWPRALLPLYSFWLQKKSTHTDLKYKFLAENSIKLFEFSRWNKLSFKIFTAQISRIKCNLKNPAIILSVKIQK